MYLAALRIFCDVVRQRSFSKAAAANQISQSAASQNVSQLEKTLGVRLIDRSQRPFKLTAEGELYYEGCRALVDRYYDVETQVKQLRSRVCGTLKVAAIYSAGIGRMSRYVQQFAQRFPQANVELSYLHPDRVQESVIKEEADLGLISYPKHLRGLAALPWRNEEMAVVCRPDHPLASRRQLTGMEINGERLVGFAEELRVRKEIDRELRKFQVTVEVGMSFDNIETIKRAVEIGEGIAILPEPTVQNEVATGTLVTVPLIEPTLVRPLAIIHRKGAGLSKVARNFIALIQGTLDDRESDRRPVTVPFSAEGHEETEDRDTEVSGEDSDLEAEADLTVKN